MVFRLEKTRRKKTVLHICCKYGHKDLCDEIIKTCRSILHDVDDEEWNALHYAAKGGNLKFYKIIEKSLPGCLCALTFDKKNCFAYSLHKQQCRYLSIHLQG